MAEETQEELMERVKKMSPEELAEFQKSRCIFCQIIGGNVQSKKIYEDKHLIAILDINPANPGHLLLMPKEHYAIMPQVPEDVLKHLFIVAKKLSQIALQAIGAKGTNIVVQNGMAAGQKAQHFMIHIIPRMEGDGLPFELEKKTISDGDYSTIKSRLTTKINEIFGIQSENVKEAEVVDEQTKNVEEIKEAQIVDEQIKNVEDVNSALENNSDYLSQICNYFRGYIYTEEILWETIISKNSLNCP